MYFDNFPTIIYDSQGDGDFKDVKNLLRRVGLRVHIRTNVLLYDTYDVKEGETPEIIASKLYGDPELHWVILMINNVTDRFHQWPMSTPQFLEFINDKYSNPDGIHHYEVPQSSGDTSVFTEVYSNSALYTGDTDFYSSATAITNRQYEESEQDKKRQIRLLDPRFIDQFVEEYEILIKESVV